MRRAWSGSLAGLRSAGENALVVLVTLLPWLVVLGFWAAIIVVVLRRLRRSRTAGRR
jgi:hypothetical protein